jgi:diadenosine tetraphosphate (Ap4A) HIT family hydrolase
MCSDDRSDDEPNGVRFLRGRWSDAYLGRHGPARGYAYAIWRGRHVAEPTELVGAEACWFWEEVLRAARAIERVYSPCKMNYELLGNGVPHLHVHLVPRYLDDIAPGRPLPSAAWASGDAHPLTEDDLRSQVSVLRALIEDG